MLYTEKEKHEIERVKEAFAEHLRQSPDFELLWSDKVGYVWLTIGVNPLYVDTGIRIESAADLCYKCLDDVAMDQLHCICYIFSVLFYSSRRTIFHGASLFPTYIF